MRAWALFPKICRDWFNLNQSYSELVRRSLEGSFRLVEIMRGGSPTTPLMPVPPRISRRQAMTLYLLCPAPLSSIPITTATSGLSLVSTETFPAHPEGRWFEDRHQGLAPVRALYAGETLKGRWRALRFTSPELSACFGFMFSDFVCSPGRDAGREPPSVDAFPLYLRSGDDEWN